MSKKYRLLKDLPGVQKGSIYTQENKRPDYYNSNGNSYYDRVSHLLIENNPDWFEEVKPSQPIPEKESKDVFTWDDELVLEMARELDNKKCLYNDYESNIRIKNFKQSKQPPTPQKEWEIVSVKDTHYNNIINADRKLVIYEFEDYLDGGKGKYEKGRFQIHSVRRLSDNIVFSVGDEVDVEADDGKGFRDTINYFTYCAPIIDVYFKCNRSAFNISHWLKRATKPTPSPKEERIEVTPHFINYNLDVKYTQEQMDKAIEDAFNAARELLYGGKITGYFEKTLKYPTDQSYIQSLKQ